MLLNKINQFVTECCCLTRAQLNLILNLAWLKKGTHKGRPYGSIQLLIGSRREYYLLQLLKALHVIPQIKTHCIHTHHDAVRQLENIKTSSTHFIITQSVFLRFIDVFAIRNDRVVIL